MHAKLNLGMFWLNYRKSKRVWSVTTKCKMPTSNVIIEIINFAMFLACSYDTPNKSGGGLSLAATPATLCLILSSILEV